MKDTIIEKMYELSRAPYQKYFKKNEPWQIDKSKLLDYPEGTLGFGLGNFLYKNHFDIQPKLEDHDIIHVLTNTGTSVLEEIGMQCYLLGNGKRSLYLFLVTLSGTIFYPTKINYFLKEYQRGKLALPFHYLDFSKMLLIPVSSIQKAFKIQNHEN